MTAVKGTAVKRSAAKHAAQVRAPLIRAPLVRAALIGAGDIMCGHHLPRILAQSDRSEVRRTQVRAICEPNPTHYEACAQQFAAAGLPVPPNEPDLEKLLADHGDELDAAFIVTPHHLHFPQAERCLRAGLDVLLEKPMVLNVAEAEALIRTRDETGRLLVVAFNGTLSPYLREAQARIRRGELGELRSISATVWQQWERRTVGTWRQVPAISGGGFLFDTGAHMLNTAAALAGEPFSHLSAWLENDGRAVELRSTIQARTASGLLVSMHACGTTVGLGSEFFVFGTGGILKTGLWVERLAVARAGDLSDPNHAGDEDGNFREVRLPSNRGAWDQFLKIRNGELENPSPPELGLRMARIYEAILASAAKGGAPVRMQGD